MTHHLKSCVCDCSAQNKPASRAASFLSGPFHQAAPETSVAGFSDSKVIGAQCAQLNCASLPTTSLCAGGSIPVYGTDKKQLRRALQQVHYEHPFGKALDPDLSGPDSLRITFAEK
jgi:hypothetical protein